MARDIFSKEGLDSMGGEGGSKWPYVSWLRLRVGASVTGIMLAQLNEGDVQLSIESPATKQDGTPDTFHDGKPKIQYSMLYAGKPNDFADCSDRFLDRVKEDGLSDNGKRIITAKSFSVKPLRETLKAFHAAHQRMPVAGDMIRMTLKSKTYGPSSNGNLFEFAFAPGTEQTKKIAADHLAELLASAPKAPADDPWGADSADDSLPPF